MDLNHRLGPNVRERAQAFPATTSENDCLRRPTRAWVGSPGIQTEAAKLENSHLRRNHKVSVIGITAAMEQERGRPRPRVPMSTLLPDERSPLHSSMHQRQWDLPSLRIEPLVQPI